MRAAMSKKRPRLSRRPIRSIGEWFAVQEFVSRLQFELTGPLTPLHERRSSEVNDPPVSIPWELAVRSKIEQENQRLRAYEDVNAEARDFFDDYRREKTRLDRWEVGATPDG